MSYTTLVKRIKTPGANPDVDYDNDGQEWVSVQAYLDYMDGEGAEIPLKKTLVITPQNGPRYEVWNPVSARTFVPKVMDHTHSYNDLENKPTFPTVNDATVTIKQQGVAKGSFSLNQSNDTEIDVGFGEETFFTAELLKKVLICRANNCVYVTSTFDPAPNIGKQNGFGDPGVSSTNWAGYGTAPTSTAGSRLCIHNVNVDPWKGRKFRFTAGEGFNIAIASGTVSQTGGWNKPYPQTSDLAWNWHASDDPVEVTIGDMLAIMVKKTTGTFDMNSLYSSIWFTFDVEECEDSVKNPPRTLKDGRFKGYRIGVLGDSILAGASTSAYKTAVDVLVSDYGIIPVTNCQAGTCISLAATEWGDRDSGRFVNRLNPTWRYLASGNNGYTSPGSSTWKDSDPFLGVLIFGVNDVLMTKKPLDKEPFIRVLTPHQSGGTQLEPTYDMQINTTELDSEGYLSALLELEASVKAAGGSQLSHFYLVGPYMCTWPGNFPMNTLSKNPNGDTGEDFIRIQRGLCMIKGWSYMDLLSSQINTFLPGVAVDNLHPSQKGHQMLGDYLGQMLCGTVLTQASPIFEQENEGAGTSVQLTYKEGYNLFDLSSVERGKGLNPNTGEITDDSQSILSNLIVIPPASERGATGNLHFFNLPVTTASKRFVQLDSEMNIVRGPSDITASDTTAEIGIHSDAKYLLFTLVRAMSTLPTEQELATMYGEAMITVQYTMAEYQPFYRNVDSINGVGINASKVSGLYKGKKWVVLGDSLTERNSHSTKFYHDFVREDLGFSVVNMGVSGTGYKNRDDVANPTTEGAFYQRATQIPSDADLVTIFGSFNDITQSHTLGTPSDTGTTTICGCINATIAAIYTINPAMKLGIIAPCPWKEMNPTNSDAVAYVTALHDICAKNSIPFLDLFHESGLRPWIREVRDLVYDLDAQTGGDYHGTHPNAIGHEMLGSKIREFVKTLI